MSEYRFDLYDCFTQDRFGGNPGGIVWDADDLSADQMQAIAREIAAPVTGFVTGREGARVAARFFMPGGEIAMCGHVTIGIFTHLAQGQSAEFTLVAGAGEVPVSVDADGTVMMALGVPSPVEVAVDHADLSRALGTQVTQTGAADAGLKHLFVPLETAADVAGLNPDFAALKALSLAVGVHTVAGFAVEEGRVTIRDFCPAVGVDETPASGTTNGALAGYLLSAGMIAPKDQRIVARQGVEIGRPSEIISDIKLLNGEIDSLKVGGKALRSLTGEILPL